MDIQLILIVVGLALTVFSAIYDRVPLWIGVFLIGLGVLVK